MNIKQGGNNDNGGKQIAWGAIIAGVIVSLGYETLLNFLGIGLGFASLNSKNPHVFNLESGVTVWLVISGIISMGIGGWFVGKFSGICCVFKRGYQGVIAWSFAIFLTVLITTFASSSFMGGIIGIIAIPNSQQFSQTMPDSHNYSVPTEPPPDIAANDETESYMTNLGKAAIAIFLAFLLRSC